MENEIPKKDYSNLVFLGILKLKEFVQDNRKDTQSKLVLLIVERALNEYENFRNEKKFVKKINQNLFGKKFFIDSCR